MFSEITKKVRNFVRTRRHGASHSSLVIGIAIDLILWAAVGILALTLLSTSVTTGLSSTVGFLAITFVAIMATIAVAVAFFRDVRI